MAITSWGDKVTEDIFHGTNSKDARKIPQTLWGLCSRKLDAINAANELRALSLPGLRLEALKGNLKGLYSIRVNDQYRVIFRFANGNASDVQITDYH